MFFVFITHAGRMRDILLRESLGAESDELLTTGEAAALLGSSRQHVVNLCNDGLLPYTTIGRHRRIRRRDVELARAGSERLSRDQRRSLWLNTAVAGKLASDPRTVLRQARENLAAMQRVHTRGQGRRWLQEWERLLDGPPERIMEVLTAQTPYSREMRQNSPFGNALDADERVKVLRAFKSLTGGRAADDRDQSMPQCTDEEAPQ